MNFKFNAKMKHIFTFGGGIATVGGVVADVLTPLSSLGIWSSLAFFVAAVLTFIIGFFTPNAFDRTENPIKDLWYVPLTLTFVVTGICIATLYQINKTDNNQQGMIAQNVKIISDMQEKLGLLKDINSTLESSLNVQQKSLEVQETILKENESIRLITEGIAANTSELSATLAFSLNALNDALIRGDIDRLKRFLEQGENLEDVYIARNIVEAPLLLEAVRRNKRNMDQVLQFLDDKGLLRNSELIKINPAYSSAYNKFWHEFMDHSTYTRYYEQQYTFKDFQKAIYAEKGYIFPDNLASDFEKQELDVIGAPEYGKVSLYTEAILHENPKAVKWLEANLPKVSEDYLHMPNGAKILIRH